DGLPTHVIIVVQLRPCSILIPQSVLSVVKTFGETRYARFVTFDSPDYRTFYLLVQLIVSIPAGVEFHDGFRATVVVGSGYRIFTIAGDVAYSVPGFNLAHVLCKRQSGDQQGNKKQFW